MWKYVGFLVAAATLLLSEDAVAQKKAAGKLASPQEYQMLNNQAQLQGEIVSVGQTTVTVRTTLTSMQPNPNFKPVNNQNQNQNLQNQARAAQQQQQAAAQMAMAQAKLQAAQTPQQRQQAQQQLNQAQARLRQVQFQRPPQQQRIQLPNPNNGPFKQVQESKDFELPLADTVTVRKSYLGTEYDNTTGKLKQYTPEEIRKLKGSDASKPGYSAKLDDIQAGQQATIYLTAARNAKSVNKDAPADRPTVHMIMLTAEMAAFNAGAAPKKK